MNFNILTSITNPSSTYSDPSSISTLDSSNLVINTNNALYFNYIPRNFTSIITLKKDFYISPDSNVSGQITNYNYLILTSQKIPKGGLLNLYFPYFNSDSNQTSNMIPLFSTNLTINIGQVKLIIYLKGINQSSTLVIVSFTNVKITNICQTDCPANTQILFSLQNILNPPSLKPLQGFSINSMDSNMNLIEQANNFLNVYLHNF